jgi:hypothetical protein
VPSGIATDNTTKEFFASLNESGTLIRLYDFENAVGLFEGVGHGRFKFCLLTISGSSQLSTSAPDFFFFAHHVTDLEDQDRHFTLTAEDIALINPNTRTCPIFRSGRDAEITKAIYRRLPVLANEATGENPWGASFGTMFHMSNDAHLFRTREQLLEQHWILQGNIFVRGGDRYLPLYEAKMMHQFQHRYGDYAMRPEGSLDSELPRISTEKLRDPGYAVLPRYWLAQSDMPDLKGERWLLAFRNLARSTDERTLILAALAPTGLGHSASVVHVAHGRAHILQAALNSLPVDYVVRQKLGGANMSFFVVAQLPAPPPLSLSASDESFITCRVLELSYTSLELFAFARDCGYDGPPFRWDEDRRFLLRCELDALFFQLYGISRVDAVYILDTFPIVRRKEEAEHGEYRTKRVILEVYDAMAEAERTGVPYQTRLDPPPADPRVAHAAVQVVGAVAKVQPVRDRLSGIAAGTWATPVGLEPDNLALFALIDVLRAFGGSAKPSDVRLAALIVRNPAIALAFLGSDQSRAWVRAIGRDARPLPRNVIQISQFQKNAADLPWAHAVATLEGTGALLTGPEAWTATANFPASSGEVWMAGRADVAVDLVTRALASEVEKTLEEYLRRVEDGSAIRAVS